MSNETLMAVVADQETEITRLRAEVLAQRECADREEAERVKAKRENVEMTKRHYALADEADQYRLRAEKAEAQVIELQAKIRLLEKKPCTECGGSGEAHCLHCNNGGVNSAGGDCTMCARPNPCKHCGGSGEEPK